MNVTASKHDSAEVETWARALVIEAGEDPDQIIHNPPVMRWQAWESYARLSLLARDRIAAGPMDQIDHLREEEGASITICCDNPDAESVDTQTAIDVSASWTDWQDRRFLGRSVADCLDKAIEAMKEATHAGT